MSFTKENIQHIRNDMTSALKDIEKKHGVLFNLGRISYTDLDFRVAIKCHANSNGANSPLELEWMKYCQSYGFQTSDLMKKVKLSDEVHEILGLKVRNRKYPVITKRLRDGRQYKWTQYQVQRALEALSK